MAFCGMVGRNLREGDDGIKQDLYHGAERFDAVLRSGHSLKVSVKSLFYEAFFEEDPGDLEKWMRAGSHGERRDHVRQYIPPPNLLLTRFNQLVDRWRLEMHAYDHNMGGMTACILIILEHPDSFLIGSRLQFVPAPVKSCSHQQPRHSSSVSVRTSQLGNTVVSVMMAHTPIMLLSHRSSSLNVFRCRGVCERGVATCFIAYKPGEGCEEAASLVLCKRDKQERELLPALP